MKCYIYQGNKQIYNINIHLFQCDIYLPVERVEVSVEERGGGDAEAEQDGAGEVEGGVEAGGARVELDEANPRLASLLLRARVLTHIVCNVDIKLFSLRNEIPTADWRSVIKLTTELSISIAYNAIIPG